MMSAVLTPHQQCPHHAATLPHTTRHHLMQSMHMKHHTTHLASNPANVSGVSPATNLHSETYSTFNQSPLFFVGFSYIKKIR